jgi:hypothetical protein
MPYVKNKEEEIWFGSAMSELHYWKNRAHKAEGKIAELEAKIVRYAEFETPEFKKAIVESELAYAQRLGRSLPPDIKT